jgi:hypothetical protein
VRFRGVHFYKLWVESQDCRCLQAITMSRKRIVGQQVPNQIPPIYDETYAAPIANDVTYLLKNWSIAAMTIQKNKFTKLLPM